MAAKHYWRQGPKAVGLRSSDPAVLFNEAIASVIQVLAAAGEEVEDCSVCGEPGEVVIDPEAQDSEAVALRVMLVCRLLFLDKTLLPTKCQVVCDNLALQYDTAVGSHLSVEGSFDLAALTAVCLRALPATTKHWQPAARAGFWQGR